MAGVRLTDFMRTAGHCVYHIELGKEEATWMRRTALEKQLCIAGNARFPKRATISIKKPPCMANARSCAIQLSIPLTLTFISAIRSSKLLLFMLVFA